MKKLVIVAILVLVAYFVFFHKKNKSTSGGKAKADTTAKPDVQYDPITGFVITDGVITGGGIVKPAGTSVTLAIPPLVPSIKDTILNGSLYLET